MSLFLIENITAGISLCGIFLLLVRRVPEAVESGKMHKGGVIDEVKSLNRKTVIESLGNYSKSAISKTGKKIWNFALEAKDLKQGQMLAARFTKIVAPTTKKVINIGVHNSIKKAERLIVEKNYDAAEQEYFQVIKKHPHEYVAYEGLIKLYLKGKKYEDILEILQYLVNNNPKNDHYLVQLGNILMTTRNYTEAINAYEQALEINNLVPARYINIGLCYQALGEHSNTKKYFQKALDLEPANMQYLMMLVDILVKVGSADEARERLEKIAEMDPGNVLIREKIAELGLTSA